MPLNLGAHLALLRDEYAASLAAPLSGRQAMLVAVLADHFPDRVFAARRDTPDSVLGAEDLPAYRALLRQHFPALGTLFDLCAFRPGGPRLLIKTVEVPLADYPRLSVEDFMLSLYNRHTVQRVRIAGVAFEHGQSGRGPQVGAEHQHEGDAEHKAREGRGGRGERGCGSQPRVWQVLHQLVQVHAREHRGTGDALDQGSPW